MLISNRCILCGAVLGPAQGQMCQDCYADLPTRPAGACLCCGVPEPDSSACVRCFPRPPAFDSCIAGKIYRYPVDLMIKQLKYQARLDTVRSLSRCLIERIRLDCSRQRSRGEPPECLVPTPLHSSRQRTGAGMVPSPRRAVTLLISVKESLIYRLRYRDFPLCGHGLR